MDWKDLEGKVRVVIRCQLAELGYWFEDPARVRLLDRISSGCASAVVRVLRTWFEQNSQLMILVGKYDAPGLGPKE